MPDANNVVVDSNLYVLTKTGEAAIPTGIAALANIGYRVAPNTSVGISLGAGATIEAKPRIAYLGGLGIFLGSQHQFGFTIGASLMQVNVLNAAIYPVGTQYKTPGDVEYLKKWAGGGFLSVTYTLFSSEKSGSQADDADGEDPKPKDLKPGNEPEEKKEEENKNKEK